MRLTEAFHQYRIEAIQLQGLSDKTWKNHRTAMNSLVACTGDLPIQLLTLDHIVQWKMYMTDRGNSASTISHNLGRLRNILRFCSSRRMNVLDYRDVTLPKVIHKMPTYVYSEEVKAMIDATDNLRDKAIMACLFSTGCRISELLNLNREDIRGDEVMVTGKGSKTRMVFIEPTAMRYLQDYLESRKDHLTPLFVSGQRRRITVQRVEQFVHDCADAAGIDKNITPHSFRHGFATDLVKNGADIISVKDMMGHNSIQTTQIYTHMSNPHLRSVHKKYHDMKAN